MPFAPGSKVKFVVPRSAHSLAKMNHWATVTNGTTSNRYRIVFSDDRSFEVFDWQIQAEDAKEGPSCRTST